MRYDALLAHLGQLLLLVGNNQCEQRNGLARARRHLQHTMALMAHAA